MNIETKGLGAGSYPEPYEEEEKEIKAKVYITFKLQYSVPKNWDKEKIIQDIKENINDFVWYDEIIEEVEVN